jgi:hypothetical protein
MTPQNRPIRGFLAIPALALAACGMLAAPAPLTSSVAAAPEPSPVPKRWQLDVECSPLRWITIDTGQGAKPYYFMTYKVTNNSPVDLLFAPVFELATSDQDVLRSGRDVPVAVTNELLRRLNNPFLQDQISIVDNLLRGEENAREGLVIWPITTDHLNEVTVYAAGFSGETATIEIPKLPAPTPVAGDAVEIPGKTAAAQPSPKVEANAAVALPPAPAGSEANAQSDTEKKVLRKTLMLRYRMPGDLTPASGGQFQAYEQRWIMR